MRSSLVSLPSEGSTYCRDLECDPMWPGAVLAVGEDNSSLLMLVLRAWTSLLADSPSGLKPNRVIHRFLNEALSDPFGLIARYDALSLELQRSFEGDADRPLIEPLHHLFRDTPVFKEYYDYLAHGDPVLLRYLLSFLSFAKKVQWSREQLEPEALRSWLGLEEDLGRLDLSSVPLDLIRGAIEDLTASWSAFEFFPRHGTGSVAQRLSLRGTVSKNDCLLVPAKISYMYFETRHRPAYASGLNIPDPLELDPEALHREAAKFLVVPKSYKSVRSICMEPIAYQYAQQAVLSWMTDNISSSLANSFVRLEDQAFNRSYAQKGSKDLSLDTIDLSSASDSVSWELVKSVFPTKILIHLAATRSTQVELPDGTVVAPHKFAPMGSAVCFPTQTLIYLATVIVAGTAVKHGVSGDDGYSLLSKYDVRNYIRDILSRRKGTHQPPRVYGDDIICDKHVTPSVISLLSSMGFAVNTHKSFVGVKAYRESCGGHFCYGHDVTFFSMKGKPFQDKIGIHDIGSLIDQANRCADFGYFNVRQVIVNTVLHCAIEGVRKVGKGLNPILFVDSEDRETSFAVRSLHPHNKHLLHRRYTEAKANSTAAMWQRDEVRSVAVGATKVRRIPGRHDWYHYDVWWRGRRHRLEPDRLAHLGSSQGRLVVESVRDGPVQRWTPA